MKKTLSWLLTAILLLTSAGALAAEYTLDQKLQMQLRDGSGLKATVDFAVSPNARMTALDQVTNTVLNALLPRSKLDIRSIRGAGSMKGQEDLTIALLRGDQQAAQVHYTTDGTLEALSSTLLGTQSLASLKGDGLILSLFTGEGGRWPGIERALFAMNGADNEWRSKAETALRPYLDKMSLWLQGYTKTSSTQDDAARAVTLSVTTIPASALKTQMKSLLSALYADAATLTLLRQQLSAREASAYLEPGLLPGLQQAIDSLPLTGEVKLQRSYDSKGALVLDEVLLPMGGTRGLDSLLYRFEVDKDGSRRTSIVAVKVTQQATSAAGETLTLWLEGAPLPTQAEGMETGAYTGQLTIQPEALSFTVGTNPAATQSPAALERTMGFELTYTVDKEVLDDAQQQSTRPFTMDLKLTPAGFDGLGQQQVKAEGLFRSGTNSRSATHLTAEVVWTDLSTQGSITMNVAASSAAPWAIPTVAATGAVRLDSLSEAQLLQQRTAIQAALQAGIAQLTQQYLSLPTTAP